MENRFVYVTQPRQNRVLVIDVKDTLNPNQVSLLSAGLKSGHKRLMSHCIRKPTKCLGENKGADQLGGNREADQRLCFRYTDSTIPLLKSV